MGFLWQNNFLTNIKKYYLFLLILMIAVNCFFEKFAVILFLSVLFVSY
jgi:hypothetical protein